MTKIEEMQEIKKRVMVETGYTNDQAVRYIALLLSRSPYTIYDYLSVNRVDIPDQALELLKLKLKD
jgi:type II secretory pathway predicted ATPase ExeA